MPARSFGEAPTFTEEDIETPDIDTNMATNILNTNDIMPPCHQDVVISGVSCRLPQSDNMEEFRDNLMNGVDMVTEDDSRWQPGMYGLPARSGKLKDLTKFDAAFFGVHPKQANSMDPQLRLLLEVTHEAIVDAGVNPESVRGSKTGVFIGASASESHEAWSADPDNTVGYSMTGCTRSMFANRLSYAFDFKGPSYSIDTACSSSLLALDQALHSIRSGQCDAAIVGGSNLCLKPTTALQFLKLGMLSPDGMCKSFDAEGNGYCRSEGIVAMYLQKEMTAKRVYCTLVHSKTNSDGSKQQGITFPSGEVQKSLLYDVYSEACINPSEVAYVEAHGTGTQAGDPQEVNSICDVFCKDRQGPLKIGSVKSNMGHSEPASGLAAVAKVIVAMEEKTIPGNLHYNTPNINIPGLVDGKLNVVDCDTKWDGGLVGVNSFGFGGSNVHSVLKSNSQHASQCESCEKRRLFLYSSRSEKGLKEVLEKVRKHPEDLSLHGLMNETAFTSPSSHPYRGFTVLNGSNHINIQKASTESRPVWYVFAGMGTQWQGMGRQMMEVDTFKASIMKSDKVLRPYGVRLYDMLMIGDDGVFEDTVNSFVAIAAIQVALVDMLMRLGIRADGIVGHSVGELGCAYADGCLTAEETVLAAYWRGHCIKTAKLPPGGMAAVGLTWQEALDQCPPGVVPACHNAEDTVTISGPKESVSKFVLELKAKQIFAKEVNSAGVAFHSYYMKGIAPTLKAALDKVITTPKLRTDRWISSSIPECNWSTDLARFSSAAYHVNNLVSPVLFQEALGRVPANAVVIEIAPHCLLQAILKRSLSTDCCIVGLMKRGHENNVEFCFSSLGRCYQNGVHLDPLRLCPPVTFPVPSGTPMVSPLVKWDHEQSWNVPTADMFIGGGGKSQSGCSFDFDMSHDSEDHYLIGHKIDGRVLFPATGYLVLAWKALAKMEGKKFDEMPILFEDVDIHRATILPEDGKIHFDVTVMPGTGNFEVMEGGSVTASGRVISPESIEPGCPTCNNNRRDYDLSTTDIYKELRLRGYDYGPTFQGIVGADLAGIHGELRWTGDWISYLDTMLQMTILSQPGAGLRLPTRMKSVAIDPVRHHDFVRDHGNGEQGISVEVDQYCDTCISGSVTILGLHATSAPRRHDYHQPIIEKYSFIPCLSENLVQLSESMAKYVSACLNCSFKGLTELIEKHGNNGLKNKDHIKAVLYEAVEKGLEHVEDAETVFDLKEHGCLSLLKKIYELEYNEMFAKSILHLVESNFEMLSADCLLNYMASSEYLKPCLDLVIENVSSQNLKILEVTRSGMNEHVMPLLSSHPLIHTTYTMTVDKSEELESADFDTIKWSPEDVPPPSMKKVHLATACNVLHKQKNITTALCNIAECVEEGGFMLVQEVTQNFHLALPLDGLGADVDSYDLSDRSCSIYCTSEKWREIFTKQGFVVIYERSDSFISTMFLLRKCSQSEVYKQTLLHISELEFDWVEEMKRQMLECQTKPKGENLWLIADSNASGIVGMVNCLRQEPGGERIRCILNLGKQRIPDIHVAMEMLVQTDLVMNIYRDGQWGTFRHLPLQPACLQESEHAYVNVQTRGDLSSLQWIQSPLRHFNTEENPGAELCNVHYASLNFRDVMLATGKLPPDAIPGGLANQECMLGMEFSGTDGNGRRVMGLVPAKGLATTVDVRKSFLWPVPDTWSLEEAASVPVVYTTAYYALVVRGNIRHGNKVLIHSGSGGVGQAAISIALHYGCEVFTTVGSAEKREYLQSRFPELDDGHFFNSRNTAFEFGVLKATRGKGVDIVLNSLAEEKLQASLRVLAQHGRFLEIGKFDLSNNTSLGMSLFLKNISFHGILLDALFEEGNNDWEVVSKCLCDGIKSGAVQPLKTTKFGRSDVELAFRFMAQGKHIGKVVVQVREDTKMVARTPVPAVARSACDPQKCYIITGGLGGFGLELANWLVERGARSLILTSRSGVRTGYQARKIKYLQNLGVEVIVSSKNVCNSQEVCSLLTETNSKPVGGVFHLAMVLKDGFLENQDVESFMKVCSPKVKGTINLDKATRELCKESCHWFVVFSSVSCGRGNAGQSNYGFANSVMERICEERKQDGFAGLAVQWGAIGDVGIVLESMGDNDTVIGGTLPQRITSCLATLDLFLNQSEPVVSSFVLAEKQGTSQGGSDKLDLVFAVCHILGVSDPNTVDPDTSLGDLGLDSLMGVEVKQTLERGFDISMAMREIRQLTVNKLRGITSGTTENNNEKDMTETSIPVILEIQDLMPSTLIVELNDSKLEKEPIYIIHPIEGNVSSLREMSSKIGQPVFGVQCTCEVPTTSVHDMAQYYVQRIQHHNHNKPFHLAGYSFGACIAIEMALQAQAIQSESLAQTSSNQSESQAQSSSNQSESQAQSSSNQSEPPTQSSSNLRSLTLLDGSHKFVAAHTGTYREQMTIKNSAHAETVALCAFLEKFTTENLQMVLEQLLCASTFEERLHITVAKVTSLHPELAADNLKLAAKSFYQKLLISEQYEVDKKYDGDITLIVAEKSSSTQTGVLKKDYGLKQICLGEVKVHTVSGDHASFLQGDSGISVADVISNVTK